MIQAALNIVALGLLGEDHGLMETGGNGSGKSNAAGLGGENHGDLIHIEIFAEFLGNMAQQLRVDAVVQKTVHLNDVAGQNLALLDDALFQLLHIVLSLV